MARIHVAHLAANVIIRFPCNADIKYNLDRRTKPPREQAAAINAKYAPKMFLRREFIALSGDNNFYG